MEREWKELFKGLDQKLESVEDKIQKIEKLLDGKDLYEKLEFLQLYENHLREKGHAITIQKRGYVNKGLLREAEKQKALYRKNKDLLSTVHHYKLQLKEKWMKRGQDSTSKHQPRKEKKPELRVKREVFKEMDDLFGERIQEKIDAVKEEPIYEFQIYDLQKILYHYRNQVKKYLNIDQEEMVWQEKLRSFQAEIRKGLDYLSALLAYQNDGAHKGARTVNRFMRYYEEESLMERMGTSYTAFLEGNEKAVNQKEIQNYLFKMNSRQKIAIQDVESYSDVFRYFIRNRTVEEFDVTYLKDMMYTIWELEEKEQISKEEVETVLLSVLDTVVRKKKSLSREEKKERLVLKKMQEHLNLYLSLYKMPKKSEMEKHYDYDMCLSLVSNPVYFSILEEVLQKIPALLNVYNEENSILFTIVDSYIRNKKWELGAENGDHIPSSHFRDVCTLFMKNEKLNSKERIRIEEELVAFKEWIMERHSLKDSTRVSLLDEIEGMMGRKKEEPIVSPLSLEDAKNKLWVNIQLLARQKRGRFCLTYTYLSGLTKAIENFKEGFTEKYGVEANYNMVLNALGIEPNEAEESYFVSKTLSFGGTSAYSIRYSSKGAKYLRLHEIDFDAIVGRDAEVEEYLYKQFVEGKESGLENKEYFQFQKGIEVPTITYQMKISPDGKFMKFKMFRSLVAVDEVVPSLEGYRENEILKAQVGLYRALSHDTSKDISIPKIEKCFMKILKGTALEEARFQNLPLIRSREITDAEQRLEILNAFYEYGNKIDTYSYNLFVEILKEPKTHKKYTNNWAVPLSEFPLETAQMNYQTVLNQRILMNKDVEQIDRLHMQSIEAVTEVNSRGKVKPNKAFQKRFKRLTK